MSLHSFQTDVKVRIFYLFILLLFCLLRWWKLCTSHLRLPAMLFITTLLPTFIFLFYTALRGNSSYSRVQKQLIHRIQHTVLSILLKDWNYHSSDHLPVSEKPKRNIFPEVRTNITCAFQKVNFKLVFWNKGLTEQYFHSVSGTFIMPSVTIVPPSNRNFIMYSNWWAESFSSHNKLSSAGFISRTTMVSSGQSFIFNFWIYEMQIARSLILTPSHGK